MSERLLSNEELQDDLQALRQLHMLMSLGKLSRAGYTRVMNTLYPAIGDLDGAEQGKGKAHGSPEYTPRIRKLIR